MLVLCGDGTMFQIKHDCEDEQVRVYRVTQYGNLFARWEPDMEGALEWLRKAGYAIVETVED